MPRASFGKPLGKILFAQKLFMHSPKNRKFVRYLNCNHAYLVPLHSSPHIYTTHTTYNNNIYFQNENHLSNTQCRCTKSYMHTFQIRITSVAYIVMEKGLLDMMFPLLLLVLIWFISGILVFFFFASSSFSLS